MITPHIVIYYFLDIILIHTSINGITRRIGKMGSKCLTCECFVMAVHKNEVVNNWDLVPPSSEILRWINKEIIDIIFYFNAFNFYEKNKILIKQFSYIIKQKWNLDWDRFHIIEGFNFFPLCLISYSLLILF